MIRHAFVFSLLLSLCWTTLVFATPPTKIKSLSLSQITTKPIPPGYHFPTPTATIDEWVATSNTAAIRKHAWDLWSGLTTNSGETYEGEELPIWETWYGMEDVFPQKIADLGKKSSAHITAATASAFLASHRGTLRAFVQPHQLMRLKSGPNLLQLHGPLPTRLLSFNKFNPQAAAFILTPQPGPDGQTYHYNEGKSLSDLNAAWPSDTTIINRSINSFPTEAIELKPLFGIVSANGLTPVPLWQGPTASTQPESPMFHTWTTCVLIDPNGKTQTIRAATEQEIASANKVEWYSCKNYLYGSLSMLYSFKVTVPGAAAFNQARGNSKIKPDDFAVLLALHVNTHETPFWTWQTFYWQPSGIDSPNNFPGSKAGQPKDMKAPWNNYATCTNYNQTTTPGGDKMDICFNPFFEVGLPAGLTSNCMSCHGVARVSANPDDLSIPLEYKQPIQFFTDPHYFDTNSTRTEFSWAVADSPVQ